jgi:hypothetical protein
MRSARTQNYSDAETSLVATEVFKLRHCDFLAFDLAEGSLYGDDPAAKPSNRPSNPTSDLASRLGIPLWLIVVLLGIGSEAREPSRRDSASWV